MGGPIVTNMRTSHNSQPPRDSQQGSKRSLAVRAALTLAIVLGFGMFVPRPAQAQVFTVLYGFHGETIDGGYPYAGVIRDSAGNLYGTTYLDGAYSDGVVFELKTDRMETILHSFAGGAADGEFPFAGLVRDASGNLYGTASQGGTSGDGIVFKLSKSGKETVLHNFGGPDGQYPYGGVIRDSAGNLYGTTYIGGASGLGTIYKVTKGGTETVLHNFTGGASDGAFPYLTGLLMDSAGNLYGVTEGGGASDNGVVYVVSPSGTLTVLHSFAGGTSDGCIPLGTPAMDKQGNLYGTASSCGAHGLGIVWKVSNSGEETVLHNFRGGPSDGAYPYAGVVRDAAGNLYGDTEEGGSDNYGTAYKLKKSGALKLLNSFTIGDCEAPLGTLLLTSDGTLFGTASNWGGGGAGTVWQITGAR